MLKVHDKEELRIFLEELDENLIFLDNAILALEENPNEKERLTEIFRVAHTIKGNAGFLNLKNLVNLAHSMEEVFQKLQTFNIEITSDIITTLFLCKDAITDIGLALKSGTDTGSIETSHLIEKVNCFLSEHVDEPSEASEEPIDLEKSGESILGEIEIIPNTILIRAWISPHETAPSIRSFLIQQKIQQFADIEKEEPSEEVKNSQKFISSNRELRYWIKTNRSKKEILEKIAVDMIEHIEIFNESDLQKNNKKNLPSTGISNEEMTATQNTVRIPVDRLDVLLNLVGELVIANSGLTQIQDKIKSIPNSLDIQRRINERVKEIFRISGDVQELVMKSRLVPLETVFKRFKRFVRDYGESTGKKIKFEISGENTEIDKKIIDEISTPLTHIIRNSVDHGIEESDIRKVKGKNETGILRLSSYQEGNYIYIVTEDDGKGIDLNKVLKKAIRKGIVTEDEASYMKPQKIKELIFHSGLSTKEKVDDISGRGIGMDVVKNSIDTLNGTIDLTSEQDAGTKIVIKLPLTLAIINALIVKIADQIFSIPMSAIIETQKIHSENILLIEGNEMIRLRDTLIPLIRLDKLLELDNQKSIIKQQPVIIVEYNETLIGLLIDEFQNRHEMVIKSLADHYRPVEGISGASILGDGTIILILDVHSIITLYTQRIENINVNKFNKNKKPIKNFNNKSSSALPTQKTSPNPKKTDIKKDIKMEQNLLKEPQAIVDEMISKAKEGAALSFQSEEISKQDFEKLKYLFTQKSKELLKKWLQIGNKRAIKGIQAMTGSTNIKLEKSRGRHVNPKQFNIVLQDILKQDNLIDFLLPMNPISGEVHFLLTMENAHKIVKKMMIEANIETEDPIEIEPLMEVTNIIGSSYTNSLTQVSEVPIEPGVPILYENKSDIIKIIEDKMKSNEIQLLQIENKFKWEGEDIRAELLILIPRLKFDIL